MLYYSFESKLSFPILIPSQWRNTGSLKTYSFWRKARENGKLHVCNYAVFEILFQMMDMFKTNCSSSECFHFKFNSCITLACYVSIADVNGVEIQHQSITSHKANERLIRSLSAIVRQISNYNSMKHCEQNRQEN